MRYQTNTKPNASSHFVRTHEFVDLTGMEHATLYILLESNRLPIAYIEKHLHIDISDTRAKCWLPEAKKDLF